jgi:hypothetical protein
MLNLTTITMKNGEKKAKRSLSSSSSSSQSSSSSPPKETFPYTSTSWPRFISIKATPQHSLPKNPFLVAKTIQSVAGELKTVKRLRDDSLLLECVSFQQAKNLLSLTQFAGTPVLSAPHRTLNSCRGIIRDRERSLQALSEDEIADELESQGISSVKRFSINKDGKTIPTNTYLLTFNSATLPSNIKAGYLNLYAALPANNMGLVHAHVKTLLPVATAVPRNMTATVAEIHHIAASVMATIFHHPRSGVLG